MWYEEAWGAVGIHPKVSLEEFFGVEVREALCGPFKILNSNFGKLYVQGAHIWA